MFTGTFTALVTPFRDGELDEAAFEKLVRSQIKGGVDGIVPMGTTGESPTLDYDEHLKVIELAVKFSGGSCQSWRVWVAILRKGNAFFRFPHGKNLCPLRHVHSRSDKLLTERYGLFTVLQANFISSTGPFKPWYKPFTKHDFVANKCFCVGS